MTKLIDKDGAAFLTIWIGAITAAVIWFGWSAAFYMVAFGILTLLVGLWIFSAGARKERVADDDGSVSMIWRGPVAPPNLEVRDNDHWDDGTNHWVRVDGNWVMAFSDE